MIRLIRGELVKLRTTQVWFWLLLATVAVAVLLVVAGIASHDGVRDAGDVPSLFATSAQADLIVFVLGVLGVTTEFRYQTITPTVLQTPSRWAVVGAKMITYAIVGVLYALVSVLLQIAVAVPWLSAKGIHVDFGAPGVWHALLGVIAVVALFGVIGLGVGALLRNQIVAVVVGILFLAVVENILLAIPVVRNAWPFMPGGAAAGILRTRADDAVVKRRPRAVRGRRRAGSRALGDRPRGARRRVQLEPRHHVALPAGQVSRLRARSPRRRRQDQSAAGAVQSCGGRKFDTLSMRFCTAATSRTACATTLRSIGDNRDIVTTSDGRLPFSCASNW